ncbi:MAG: aminotransferase class I/II-fold pyridoxal phosphate-dependent enzyme, partial [Pseudomonadota bacterium]
MSKLAADHNAINLSQGYPDFDGPAELLERVNYYFTHGFNQYPPMTGVPALREQIALKIERLYGRAVSAESEITVTSGATEALFGAITAVITPGDEAIVFDPAYDSYDPAVALNGGKTIHIPLKAPEFGIDWQRLQNSINDNTRLIMLNSPHNPTGSILTQADLDQLAEIISNRNICIISDEVYE